MEREEEREQDDLPAEDDGESLADLGIGEDEAEDDGDGDASEGEPEGDESGSDEEPESDDEQPEQEGDPEDEPEDDPGQEVEAEGAVDKSHVPYSRFKDVNDRRKAAEQELERLKGSASGDFDEKLKAAEAELDAIEDKMEEARLEADTEALRALRQQSREKNREIARIEEAKRDDMVRRHEATIAEQRTKLTERSIALVQKYPVLADDDKGGDPDARNAVIKIQHRLVARGASPIDALEEAAEIWADARGVEPNKPGKSKAAVNRGDARRADALKRHAAAAERQPPHTPGLGNGKAEGKRRGGMNIDPDSLSADEYEKLDESEREELLGIA